MASQRRATVRFRDEEPYDVTTMTLTDLLANVHVWLEHDAVMLLGTGELAGHPVAFVAVDEDADGEVTWLVAASDLEITARVFIGMESTRALFDHGSHRWVVATRPDGGLSLLPADEVPESWLPTHDAFLTAASGVEVGGRA